MDTQISHEAKLKKLHWSPVELGEFKGSLWHELHKAQPIQLTSAATSGSAQQLQQGDKDKDKDKQSGSSESEPLQIDLTAELKEIDALFALQVCAWLRFQRADLENAHRMRRR